MRRLSLFAISIVLLSIVVACGAQAPVSPSGGTQGLSAKLLKLAATFQEGLSVNVEIFDSTKKSLGQKDLAIDWVQQRVYTPDSGKEIKLERGNHYSFLILFSFQTPNSSKLPVAFVLKSQDITEEFPSITWSVDEIITSPLSPEAAANLIASNLAPDNVLPNLDTNQNGMSNLQEFIEGLNPADANSTPLPPDLVGTIPQEGHVDTVEIEIDFVDPSGVARVEPEAPTCGYSFWQVTSVNDTTKHLKASFNLHSFPAPLGPGEITLKFSARDMLGAARSYSYRVKYIKTDVQDPEKLGPEISIFKPSPRILASGPIDGEAEACDAKGIKKLEIVNEGADLGDIETSDSLYEGKINTEALGDGENRLLEFRAVAGDGKTKIRSVPITVINDSPIKVDEPVPGGDVIDELHLVAYVNTAQMPLAAFLSVNSVTSSLLPGLLPEEQDEDFNFASLKEVSTDTVYAKKLDVGFVQHELYFTVSFRAVSEDGKEAIRKVPFHVNNDPDIDIASRNSDGKFNPVLSPGLGFIDWEVTNRGPNDKIVFNGQDQNGKSSGSIPLILQGNAQDNNLATHYNIYAERTGLNNQVYSTSKEMDLTLVKLQGFESGFINPKGNTLNLIGAPDTTSWKAIFESGGDTLELTGVGNKIPLVDLQPRSDYEVVVQILNASGKGIITESLPIRFTTIDTDLISWSPFYQGLNDYGQIFDKFGDTFQMLNPFGAQWKSLPLKGVYFPNGGHLTGKSSTHASPFGLSLELLLSIEDPEKTVDNLVSKAGEYALGYDPQHGYKMQLQLDGPCSIDLYNTTVGSGIMPTTGPHHVVATYNTSAKELTFYVDGQKKSFPISGTTLQNGCNGPVVLNGKQDWNNVFYKEDFDGLVSDLAIYNRALSEDEALAACHRAKICP